MYAYNLGKNQAALSCFSQPFAFKWFHQIHLKLGPCEYVDTIFEIYEW